jgi:hypothetical protein
MESLVSVEQWTKSQDHTLSGASIILTLEFLTDTILIVQN